MEKSIRVPEYVADFVEAAARHYAHDFHGSLEVAKAFVVELYLGEAIAKRLQALIEPELLEVLLQDEEKFFRFAARHLTERFYEFEESQSVDTSWSPE